LKIGVIESSLPLILLQELGGGGGGKMYFNPLLISPRNWGRNILHPQKEIVVFLTLPLCIAWLRGLCAMGRSSLLGLSLEILMKFSNIE
jgi:hypothetical protein